MAQPFNYEIRGSIKHYKPGQKMYFMHSDKGQVFDTAPIVNGKFSFKGTTELSNEPDENHNQSSARLFIDKKAKGINFKVISSENLEKMSSIQLYLVPGITQVNITDATATATVVSPSRNSEYYMIDSINKAQETKTKMVLSQAKKKYGAKADIWKYTSDQRLAIDAEHKKNLWQFVKDNPSSPVSLSVMKYYTDMDPSYSDVAPYYERLSPKLKQTTFGQRYATFVKRIKNVEVGKYAPDFTLKTLDGKPVSLASFKGKYLLLDFWASWCGPCREENPNLKRVYNKFKGQNFAVLGVSLDTEKKDWEKAIADDHLTWAHVSDLKGWDNAVAKLYAVRYVPQNFLINPQGQIISHTLRGDDLEKKLNEIFHLLKNKKNRM